jgi:hypothetical protein
MHAEPPRAWMGNDSDEAPGGIPPEEAHVEKKHAEGVEQW